MRILKIKQKRICFSSSKRKLLYSSIDLLSERHDDVAEVGEALVDVLGLGEPESLRSGLLEPLRPGQVDEVEHPGARLGGDGVLASDTQLEHGVRARAALVAVRRGHGAVLVSALQQVRHLEERNKFGNLDDLERRSFFPDLRGRLDLFNLEICHVDLVGLPGLEVGTAGAGRHLDVVLEVLLRGEQVANLFVINLQEAGFHLVAPALTK